MDYNLLLITTLEYKGYSTTIINSRFNVIDSNRKVLSRTRVSTSYLLDYSIRKHYIS